MLAAQIDARPELGKYGPFGLPRAAQALRGWKKRCPPRMRTPEPYFLWAAIVNVLVSQGHLMAGLFILLGISTYLRRAQLLSLATANFIPPSSGVATHWSLLVHPWEGSSVSKTGEKDVSMLLDGQRFSWLTPLYLEIARRAPEAPLFLFSYPVFCTLFAGACAALGVTNVVPYQMRHTGASLDRASGARTLLEVQQRLGHRQFRSVLRYEKHARLAKAAQKYSVALTAFGKRCEVALADIVLRRRVLPVPTEVDRAR